MRTLTSVKDIIAYLVTSKGKAIWQCAPGKSQASRIRAQALRSGFKIRVKQIADGYIVEYAEPVSAEAAQAATRKKTAINTRHQASKQTDWNPAAPSDPLLGGLDLEDVIDAAMKSGGGTVKTQCKIHQIHIVAKKLGADYEIKTQPKWREVIIK